MFPSGINESSYHRGDKRAVMPDDERDRADETARAVDGTDTRAPIDTEMLLERCVGNVEFAESLLEEFAQSSIERIQTISRHVVEGDADAIAETSHALKGTAAILAAEDVRSAAARLEATGRSGDLTDAGEAMSRLREEMQRCVNHIRENERGATEPQATVGPCCGGTELGQVHGTGAGV